MNLDMQFSRCLHVSLQKRRSYDRVNMAGVGPAKASGRHVLQMMSEDGLKWTRTTDLTLIRRAL